MKIAITGGTGFVGRNIARLLVADGHEVVLIARGYDRTDPRATEIPNSIFVPSGLDCPQKLTETFAGCDAVAHCAGINRELGAQTYERVHVNGTQNVVKAAARAGVQKIALVSFLRARPDCGSRYHESKWAAEEIVRSSGLNYTIFKCGVIYGKGDHMLNHLSRAFYTFPIFAFVGYRDKPIRPNAVSDIARIVKASLVNGVLSRRTVAVVGPEELTLREAVRRVAKVVGKRPLMIRMPVWFHYLLAWVVERVMTVPLVSVAQIRMLVEGLAEPVDPCEHLPAELAPVIAFNEKEIRKGLPSPAAFSFYDIRCCRKSLPSVHTHRVFFEMP